MWSTPIVTLAILAIAFASPIPQTTPGSLVSETTTLLTTMKKDEAAPTASGDLHSLPTESTTKMTTTKKHFTFKPFTFSPRTLKPITFKTLKPLTLKPLTPTTARTPITGKPLDEKVALETSSSISPSTTTVASMVNPTRQVRSVGMWDGNGWQLVETPSTVKVLPGQELTTPFSTSTLDVEHSTPITAATLKPLDLTTPEKENDTTTSGLTSTVSTILPTTTTAPLPKRLVRAAFLPAEWQVTDLPEEVLLTSTTEIPTDLPEESSSTHSAPGWEMSDDDEHKDSTTTAFTDFSQSTIEGDSSSTPGWEMSDDSESDIKDSTTTAFTDFSQSTTDIEGDSSSEPGWEMSDDDEHIKGEDSTTTAFTDFSDSTTFGDFETTSSTFAPITSDKKLIRPKRLAGFNVAWNQNGDMEAVDLASTEMPSDMESEMISSTEIPSDMDGKEIPSGRFGGPGWQVEMSSVAVNVNDNDMTTIGSTELPIHEDFSTSAFTDMPEELTTVPDETTVIDHSTPEFGNSFDGQPGWQIAETGSTIDIHGDDMSTSAFTDMPEELTTLPDDETTVIDHSTPEFGNSFDGQPGWQIAETGSTIDIHGDDMSTSAFTDMPEDLTTVPDEETTVIDHSTPAFGNSFDGSGNWS